MMALSVICRRVSIYHSTACRGNPGPMPNTTYWHPRKKPTKLPHYPVSGRGARSCGGHFGGVLARTTPFCVGYGDCRLQPLRYWLAGGRDRCGKPWPHPKQHYGHRRRDPSYTASDEHWAASGIERMGEKSERLGRDTMVKNAVPD